MNAESNLNRKTKYKYEIVLKNRRQTTNTNYSITKFVNKRTKQKTKREESKQKTTGKKHK